MAQAVVLLLAMVTSASALWLGTRALALRPRTLWPAVGRLFECLGCIVMFFAANTAIGMVAIIVGRSLTGTFVSTYMLTDAALVWVSCLQGLLFQCWRYECLVRR